MESIFTIFVLALTVAVSADAQSVLLAGFDGNQTANNASSPKTLTNPLQHSSAVGKVSVSLSTTSTLTTNVFNWAAGFQSSSIIWGSSSDLDPDASTANNNAVYAHDALATIQMTVSNTGTTDVMLDKLLMRVKRDNATGSATGIRVTYVSGDLSDTGGSNHLFALSSAASTIGYDFALSNLISDFTLAAGQSATFTWASEGGGGSRTRFDNIALTGSVSSGPDITAPTPNPMTWASVPNAVSASAITMTATTATDPSGAEYRFTRYAADGTTLLFTSPWQDSQVYTATGLSPNTTYTYTVTARDKATTPNAGDPSTPPASATTGPEVVVGPVSAVNSTVEASSTSILANGIAASTITVTLKDSNGLLISGEGVTLAGGPAGSTISPTSAQTTNESGKAAFTVKSTTIGTFQFTATSVTNSVMINQTVNIAFVDPATATAYNVNFLDEGQSNVTGLTGVVGGSGETWNQGTMAASALVDSSGANVSTVNVSGLGNDGRETPSAALSVFNGGRGFFAKGQDTTMSITGLTPNTAYDLYIYSLGSNNTAWGNIADSERTAGDFVTTNTVNGNGQSQWLDNGKAGTNGNSFLINGNYVVFQSIITNGSGNISILVDAYDGINGLPDGGDGDCRLYVNGLQIRPASGMSVDYTAWRNTSYPGLGLPDADDDGDGLSNGYEHIFGLNPTKSASSSPYPTPFNPGTGYFTYSRRTQSMINMNYKVWYSTNLVQWFVDNAASQTPVSTSNNVEIMGVDIDPALLSQPKLFMQVRATPISQLDVEPSLINLWGSGNTITLLFSEPMNPSSATNPENYAVTQDGVGALNITNATLNSGGVTLTLASTLGLKTGYTVNVDRVTSSTGQSLGSGVSRQFRTWDNDPNGIKVFILAGQSNMVGYGSVETGNGSVAGAIGSLRYLAVNDASYPDYNYASLLTNPLQPATSPFRTRSDVKVWWRNGASGNLGGAISKGDLGPPCQGAQTDKIGPEFAFGHILGDHYADKDVLIIKCAWGGRDLAEKFRPPSAVAKRGGGVGPFYNAIIEQTREVLNNLGTEFPAWSGRGYEIVGFAWHQGYNDRLSTAFSNEYKYNLPDLISDVRNVFNKPNMPFAIATAGMAIGAAEAPPYTGYSAVEKAQLWVAGVAQPANVLSTDTRPFWRDAAVSPASQSHHWNWSAESYFLIGKSLGDHMVDLLTP
jgi:alpha-galactosidase